MKIAMVSYSLTGKNKAGPGQMVHYLANQLVRRGHEVTMYSACAPCADARYETLQIACGEPFREFRFAWNLRKVDFGRFDVINSHGCGDLLLWGHKRPRLVHTFHEASISRLLHGPSRGGWVRLALSVICELVSAALADARVAVSASTRRYIPGIGAVIPNGVDHAKFTPGLEKKSPCPSVLFVGSMAGHERGAMLAGIFETSIRLAIPEAQLWMVCDGSFKSPGGKSSAPVAPEKLISLYRQAWVFCLPASYDCCAASCIEAMACGTAVVATPTPNTCEMTSDGRYGWVAGDAELADAILQVLKEPELRERMRQCGLRRALAFTWDAVCDQYEAVYRATGQSETTPHGKEANEYSSFRQ